MTDKEVFEKLEAEIERLENYENESVTSSDTRFGWIHGKTFALTSIRVLLDSMQKEPKECMYSKDNYTDEDRKALCDGCEEECKFNKKEEPVSEDLEEAASRYAKEEYSCKNPATLPDRCIGCFAPIMYAYKAGANWQKKKDESKVLTEEQCRKIRDDAFELGKDAMKQQMMKDAFSAEIGKQRPDYKCVLNGNIFKYDTGDKVKLIIIKED